MTPSPTPHGLRVTVRRDGVVVDQETLWRWDPMGLLWLVACILLLSGSALGLYTGSLQGALSGAGWGLGLSLALAPLAVPYAVWMRWRSQRGVLDRGSIPTPDGGALLAYRFVDAACVSLEPRVAGAQGGRVRPGETWSWRGDHGIVVDVDLVALERARRLASGNGDIAFVMVVFMLSVGVAQANFLLQLLFPQSMNPASELQAQPSPEFIARLLQKDFEGDAAVDSELADRPDHLEGNQSFYMPAGNDGTLSRAGGGAAAGDEVRRVAEEEDMAEDAVADAVEPEADDPRLEGEVPTADPPPTPEAEPEPKEEALLGEVEPDQEDPAVDDAPPTPLERFVGWGFRDWYDVRDARPEVNDRMRRHLDLARHRLRIDPDDPFALNVLGQYAYLAENNDLSRETYEKYVQLFPEESLGYNNLGLTYKRTGEYAKEEALYRKALELEPDEEHVLNNLAVNLAHQGRYDEAMEVMDHLAELTPEDPYSDLHRAKIYASMGKRRKALRHLELALEGAARLDTMHHIEFRQDIRLDPAFDPLRGQDRFRRILEEHYGRDADSLTQRGARALGGGRG